MPGEPSTAAMAAPDAAPKAAARGSSGSKSSGGGSGKSGPRSEKSVLVAAAEVVGRPLAVWSQKLLDWPKAVVAAYRAETSEHLIRFQEPPADQQPREQWVRLGSTRFQWMREQPESAAPNPTYAGSPRGDDCVGRRIKVFWPGMGRWYQGKVESYDSANRRHRIKYRDGDIQELRLRHEAVIWVDVGPMHNRPASAQQKGTPPPSSAAGKSKGAGVTAAPASTVGGNTRAATAAAASQKQQGAGASGARASPAANGAAAARSSPGAKRQRMAESSSGDDHHLRSNKSSATREGGLAQPAANAAAPAAKPAAASEQQGTAGAGAGGSSNLGSSAVSGQSLGMDDDDEEVEGAESSSGSEAESEGEEDDDGDSSVVTDDLGPEAYSSDLDDEADSDFEVESFRNAGGSSRRGGQQRRAGCVAVGGTTSGRSGPGRKRKRSGGSSRAGRKKKRSSVGRPRKNGGGAGAMQDRQGRGRRSDYNRGTVAPASVRAKPGMLRSVGTAEDEVARMAGGAVVGARVAVLWPNDQQYYKGKLLQFDSYHKRSKILYDDGEEEWISLYRETFRWLTPRSRSAGFGGEVREAAAALRPQLGDPLAAVAAPPQAAAPAAPQAGDAGGSQQPGAAAQGGASATPVCSPTPLGEVANVAVKGSPKADTAVGWQVSILFDGDGQWYRGEVLGFDRRRNKHLVLYADGEDEWVVLERESVAWHKLAKQGEGTASFPGLKPGAPAPHGVAGVGWRVGVYWPLDAVFYYGELTAFDPANGRHTIVYDDGDVRTVLMGTDKMKWVVPPGGIVDRAKVVGGGVEAADPAIAARGRRKGLGAAGESDPDYEFEKLENRGRPSMRRLPRLLTNASMAGPSSLASPSAHLHQQPPPGEASVAQLLHSQPASPYYWGAASPAAGLMLPNRSLGGMPQIPLSPCAEAPLGEPLLMRQLTRVPVIGGLSSGGGEAAPLPAPITVRIYMSSGGGSGGSAGSLLGDAAVGSAAVQLQPAGAAAQPAPPVASAGPGGQAGPSQPKQQQQQQQRRVQGRLSALDLMSRRVARAQHLVVKGVPTPLPPPAPRVHPSPGAAAGGLGHSAHIAHGHHRSAQQAQPFGPVVAGLHRLARASGADHGPLSPGPRRPHPAQSDEEASSSSGSGSSDDESRRDVSPPALLSPRSAAALNGAKIKPEQGQQGQRADLDPDGDALMLGLVGSAGDGDGDGTATPSDSGALGIVPPLVRPAGIESPFSGGGLLLRGPAAAPLPQPLQVYPGRPLFPQEGKLPGGSTAAAPRGAGGEDVAAGGRGPGSGAQLGMARSMSLTGGVLDVDAMVLPASADPMGGLLSMTGAARNDSEFNLLGMGGADLGRMDDVGSVGGLMDLERATPPPGAAAVGELLGATALGSDPLLQA